MNLITFSSFSPSLPSFLLSQLFYTNIFFLSFSFSATFVGFGPSGFLSPLFLFPSLLLPSSHFLRHQPSPRTRPKPWRSRLAASRWWWPTARRRTGNRPPPSSGWRRSAATTQPPPRTGRMAQWRFGASTGWSRRRRTTGERWPVWSTRRPRTGRGLRFWSSQWSVSYVKQTLMLWLKQSFHRGRKHTQISAEPDQEFESVVCENKLLHYISIRKQPIHLFHFRSDIF